MLFAFVQVIWEQVDAIMPFRGAQAIQYSDDKKYPSIHFLQTDWIGHSPHVENKSQSGIITVSVVEQVVQ